jgi:hypothetical protein
LLEVLKISGIKHPALALQTAADGDVGNFPRIHMSRESAGANSQEFRGSSAREQWPGGVFIGLVAPLGMRCPNLLDQRHNITQSENSHTPTCPELILHLL